MKIELLAPAGSFEAAKAAINNGCSAIYLAGQLYGARESATNFNNEQMREVIDYAHLSNIKVFVTMNTLILDDEMKDALEYVKFLYEAGVDAILIQDLGLMQLIKNNFPDLPLHASTQMHIHNLAGVKMCKTLGFTRVVLARETPIEIIKQATKLGIEIEVFVHGANCISYSGQCLFSSMQGGRSGNRGACAQPCRLPYTLHDSTHKFKTSGDYLLSPRDNYTLNNLKEIIDSGVTSLKIEGRLKRSEYVAQVVSAYANAINNIESNKPNIINESTNIEFKKIFNRGFSEGHMFNNYGKALMNYKRPNHQGIPIGKVKCIRNHKVYITLSDDLKQGDGIRILNSKADVGFNVNKLYLNDLLVNSAKANDTIAIEVKEIVATNDLVVKTSDITQLKELANSYIDCTAKTPINIKLVVKVGEPIKLILNDNINTIECKSEYVVEEAKTTSIKERLIEQVNKIKDQPFYYENAIFEIDEKGYVPIKVINELRRTAIEEFKIKRINSYHRLYNSAINYIIDFKQHSCSNTYIFIRNIEQYNIIKELCSNAIICSDSKVLCNKINDENVLYIAPRVINNYSSSVQGIGELGGLSTIKDRMLGTSSLNLYNSYTLAFYLSMGLSTITLSEELSDEQIAVLTKQFNKSYNCDSNLAISIYGRVELMVSKYCMINTVCSDGSKKGCNRCKQDNKYYIENVQGRKFPIYGDDLCNMHILDNKVRNRISNVPHYNKLGINNYIITLYDETEEECKIIIDKLKNESAL